MKFARDKRQIKENLKKILTFRESMEWDDREGVLLETLTFYIIKVTDMTQTEFKALKQQIPEPPSRKIVEIAREIFGDEVPRFLMEEWMEKFRAEVQEKVRAEVQEKVRAEVQEKVTESQKKDFTSKIILKFPDWSDAEVADFVGVTMEFTQQIRLELTRNK